LLLFKLCNSAASMASDHLALARFAEGKMFKPVIETMKGPSFLRNDALRSRCGEKLRKGCARRRSVDFTYILRLSSPTEQEFSAGYPAFPALREVRGRIAKQPDRRAPSIPQHECPRRSMNFVPRKIEGAGKAGRLMHPQPRMQK